ncbi:MAG: chromate transporter [Firmicutes bacterium]|nr:chromate transporter [Bacillota bacterium]
MIYLQLYLTFFKIGILGFGGGMAILPLIYQSVLEFTDMNPETFTNLFAISQATPGPMAVNAATFVGFQVAGVGGAAAATLGVACPSFILVALVVKFISKYHDNKLIEGAFTGIRPATVGMIGAAAIFIGQTSLLKVDVSEITSLAEGLEAIDAVPALMTVVTFVLAYKFKVGSIKLILIMGGLGIFLCSGMIF